jgi:hypothetical protein
MTDFQAQARDLLIKYAEYYHLQMLNKFNSASMMREFPNELSLSEATTNLLSLHQAALHQAQEAARIETIDKVYELSPTATFDKWSPHEALAFYERLKAYETQLRGDAGGDKV